jgi:hypothetical protein
MYMWKKIVSLSFITAFMRTIASISSPPLLHLSHDEEVWERHAAVLPSTYCCEVAALSTPARLNRVHLRLACGSVDRFSVVTLPCRKCVIGRPASTTTYPRKIRWSVEFSKTTSVRGNGWHLARESANQVQAWARSRTWGGYCSGGGGAVQCIRVRVQTLNFVS